ncbi:uncharacterized protein LOC142324749 [Lycorma delicatula]|uniref:uncharacterized protein LOC142324749 n=1 Tax=Lycorma delicatula TaxID=130591 RepID=UPI003F515E98
MICSRTTSAFFFTLLLGIILPTTAMDVKKCRAGAIRPRKVTTNVNCNKWEKKAGIICTLKRDTTVTLTIEFETKDKISFIETRGILENSHYGIYPVQLNEKFILRLDEVYLPNGDKALLPLASGETFTYKDSFDVTKNYPEGRYSFHWGLEDDSIDQEVLCFDLELEIVS